MLPNTLYKQLLSRNLTVIQSRRFFGLRRISISLLFSYLLSTTSAYAANVVSTLSAQTMLVNIANQIPNLMRLVTAFTYVAGMFLIFEGILKLKHYGESRSMMSQEHSLKGPLISLTIGAMLLYFPTTVQVGLSTFWTNPNPYGYEVGYQDQWLQFIDVCFLIIQFIGTVSFIRGLLILSHSAGHGGGRESFGKGLIHIIAGIFCINIYQFVQVIIITLGIQT